MCTGGNLLTDWPDALSNVYQTGDGQAKLVMRVERAKEPTH